ncbi:TetR/AcrR family transcriptional regulator [Pseudonocardiaceae bacterium YIM PH 21723]|nr:TetR/AcrR family transcriptional regulator [Pseudonocardiaceae bacterium YIM PH 21723]
MTETAQVNSGAASGRGVRLPRNARRAQLLTAAQDVFVNNGYHAAAMDDIAERAGVSKPVLYQHFPSKLEMYLALLETHVDELVRRVRNAVASTSDNKLRVRGAVGAYFDFVESEGAAYRLVFESDLRGEPSVLDAVERATSSCAEVIAEVVAEDTGLDAERAHLLAIALVGVSQVTARFWMTAEQSIPKEEAIALISQLAWRGIGGFPLQGH